MGRVGEVRPEDFVGFDLVRSVTLSSSTNSRLGESLQTKKRPGHGPRAPWPNLGPWPKL